ncbi:hypothetical protein NC653_028873 [Populus alba x Populus x berolinensis]|uniref:Uncharacterized protein n=1 Tax=Populus alba x Populus x berolinensis TaxID=444605 RepID=A0AAD6M0T2_9ROSI|nr:hypothetical protein NC653_028873 [Populus alba x Populus x berolinensis]
MSTKLESPEVHRLLLFPWQDIIIVGRLGFQLLYVCKGPRLQVTPSILAGIMSGLNAITETFTGNIAEAASPRQTSKLKCSFQMVWPWHWQGKLISSAEKFPTSNPRCYPLRTCLCSITLFGNPPSKFSV